MLREKTLTIASHCATFRDFCARHSAVYEGLRKRPAELEKLRSMFADGSIHSYVPASARRDDGSLMTACRPGKDEPTLTREQVREFAAFFDSFEDFRAHAGDYNVVAGRRRMLGELQKLFAEKGKTYAE